VVYLPLAPCGNDRKGTALNHVQSLTQSTVKNRLKWTEVGELLFVVTLFMHKMHVYGHEAIKEIVSSHINGVNAIDVQRGEET
jgi:hypothetical protein